ncbi:glucose-1-phosphate cytidylyltransferase [Pseudohalocynthiibacter aestuariivivens]|uniref:Glucose-1-phosphate cytidylyltransferase n=1 Tax=Roseovarius pelagicus TaxID=2980108 RepID=A0ABY6D9L5_9RHOB|nr:MULTISPECIES: glucose-1-phosphate cytidylyltransferase [Rhodobacterales]QIE45261.1 glucose-1-phosphate cytidylyltransferase [Pseudohalocynthiibacter aestuariivivens]UXX82827.1 glucose-1-phosphate cytidylyltransferase [Roseovarius pelagicus]
MVKAVILAGGLGTRISEESHLTPKPMIEIGGRPILWHIMKIYSHFGVNDFVICCGYRGYQIKEYFANYFLHMSDVTFDLANNKMEVHRQRAEPWCVTLVDTGELTQTGGRIKRIAEHLDDTFCLTYGDGVSNIDISALIAFHRAEGRDATVSAVQPAGRFGALDIEGSAVRQFLEKPKGDGQWISGGFMVCEPSVVNRIEGDDTIFEGAPLMGLAKDGQLSVRKHDGFWAAMDTLRDRNYLEGLWAADKAPWKIWS